MKIIPFVKNYLAETKIELRRVSWPTRQEVVQNVIMVVVFSAAFAAVLGLLDFIFFEIVGRIVAHS
jgi:preprotein translocase subunit SecE